jgi:nucleoside-diphosphate-sugar epimerase
MTAVPALVCLGFGYCAQRYVATGGSRFAGVLGTVRRADKAAALENSKASPPIDVVVFDGTRGVDRVGTAIADCEAVLVSIPPGAQGDLALAAFAGLLETAGRLASVVYLSSVGVYGDHGGGPVDETTVPRPRTERTRARLAAEAAWQGFGHRTGVPVAVLRLAGIYGPGRNALTNVLNGTARRIVKPGQVFNRIHVDDIAQAIDAAFSRRAAGIFNVSDDEPSPPQDVIEFAARLLGREPPPAVRFAEAQAMMTPMMRTFYAENKRVRSPALRTGLGVQLRYPTYREGLRAELEAIRQSRDAE